MDFFNLPDSSIPLEDPIKFFLLLTTKNMGYLSHFGPCASVTEQNYASIQQIVIERLVFLGALITSSSNRIISFSFQYSGRKIRQFIPMSKILKPVLNECVTPVTCYWSLSLIVRGEKELALVFKVNHFVLWPC